MQLRKHDIHIWYADDQDPGVDMSLLEPLLTPDEWERHDRFVFAKDRRQFLITRAMVRQVLSKYCLDVPPRAWTFSVNDFGKPRIANLPASRSLFFNVAHTAGAILLAVQQDPDIGVDVERFDRPLKDLSIYASVLSPIEWHHIKTQPPADQSKQFYKIWTLKEAYIKAVGQGLSIPLDSFGFDLADAGRPKLVLQGRRDTDLAKWQFHSWALTTAHAAAIAYKAPTGGNGWKHIELIPFATNAWLLGPPV